MAITALKKVSPDWFTPPSEIDDQNPTRFRLRPLTPPELESVFEPTGEGFGVPPRNYAQVLKFGIVDYDNFLDDNGKPLKCNPFNHQRIPSAIRFDLAVEILDRSQLNEDDAGNSE